MFSVKSVDLSAVSSVNLNIFLFFPVTEVKLGFVEDFIHYIGVLAESFKMKCSFFDGKDILCGDIFDRMPSGILVMKPEDNGNDFVLVSINRAAESILGVRKHSVVGRRLSSIPGHRGTLGMVRRVYRTGEPFILSRFKVDGPSGTKYLELQTYKLGSGAIVSLVQDRTEVVNLIKSLKESEERFNKVMENTMVGVFVHKDGNIIMANRAFSKISGYSEDEICSLNVFDLVDEEHRELVKRRARERMSGMFPPENYEVKVITKSGGRRWVEIYSTPIKLRGKDFILVFAIDVTDKKEKVKEMEEISFHDSLTGLYNRYYFDEELKRYWNKRNEPLSIIMADVNGLKIINDALGHKAGDEILKRFSGILEDEARANDVAARIGGDEFAVIMPNTDDSGARIFIDRVEYRIAESNRSDRVYLSVAFGYATHSGQYSGYEELLSGADASMYENKYSESRRENLERILESISGIKGVLSDGLSIEELMKRVIGG